MTDHDWQRLLGHLDALGAVVPAGDGRMALTVSGRTVTVLLRPRDWGETVGVVWGGDVDGALDGVTRAVGSVTAADRFLVYENYELHPSPTEETPMQREDRETLRRIEEIRRRDPDATFGWHAERRDGSRARFPEPPD